MIDAAAVAATANAYVDTLDAARAALTPPLGPLSGPQRATSVAGVEPIIKAIFDGVIAHGCFTLTLAVDHTLADAAVLYTVPALGGARIAVGRAFWEVVTGFSGGIGSTIGLSSSSGYASSKGDLLGGAAGDAAAALTAGFRGAVGSKIANSGLVVLTAGDTILFNKIAGGFTAGAGFAQIPCSLIPAAP